MTLHEDPDQSAVPGLEEMAGMDLDPEYVLVYLPPDACSSGKQRRALGGLWRLFPAGEREENRRRLPPEDRVLFASRSAPEPLLAEWVHRTLGYPVALEPDWAAVWGTRWHIEPLYRVRRNT